MDVLERRGFIGDDDDLVLEVLNLGIGFGARAEKAPEGKAGKGARRPHVTDKGKSAQVDGAGVIGRPVFESRIMFQALDFPGRVLPGGPGGQLFGQGEGDLAITIGHGGHIAADRPVGIGEKIHQAHVEDSPGQGGKIVRDGQVDFDLSVVRPASGWPP